MFWSTIIKWILIGLGLLYSSQKLIGHNEDPSDEFGNSALHNHDKLDGDLQFSKRSADESPPPLPIPLASVGSAPKPISEALESGFEAEASGGHSILATGWPATSPVWPTIETLETTIANANSTATKANLTEPFIYTDKQRDYNIYLNPDKRIRETLRNLHSQMEARLSFSYYFNFAQKVTKMPSIKIEIDGHLLEHLEPSLNQTNSARIWLQYNKVIDVPDSSKIDADDWLTISLKVREQTSLVAIKRLKIDLEPTIGKSTTNQQQSSKQENNPRSKKPSQSSTSADYYDPETATMSSGNVNKLAQVSTPAPKKESSWLGRRRKRRSAGGDAISGRDTFDQISTPPGQLVPLEADAVLSGSGSLSATNVATSNNQTVISLTCFKANACDWTGPRDGQEPLMWSLARMPPSTETVKNGYYYVSNRDNYGDATKLLRLSLNETELVTVAGQKADHCIRLALYITEMARVNLYRMTLDQSASVAAAARTNNDHIYDSTTNEHWIKGNLLLSWSSTLTNKQSLLSASVGASNGNSNRLLSPGGRPGPANSRMAAIDSGQMGWTYEQLCFGDFFLNVRECSLGKCAFAFEMELLQGNGQSKQLAVENDPTQPLANNDGEPDAQITSQQQGSSSNSQTTEQQQQQHQGIEQVVGVALLRHYSELKKSIDPESRSKWLESWSRPEIKPSDSWRFFPSQDVTINWRNVSFLNLYEEARYHVQSEWLEISSNMSMLGRVQIALVQPDLANSTNQTSTTTNQTTNEQQQHRVGPQSKSGSADQDSDADDDIENSFIRTSDSQPIEESLIIDLTTRLVDQNFTTIFSTNTTLLWPSTTTTTTGHDKVETPNLTLHEINLPISAHIKALQSSASSSAGVGLKLLKVLLDFSLRYSEPKRVHELDKLGGHLTVSLQDFSLSDRCFANPCNTGLCSQLGTGPDEISCKCPDEYRGIRCELGNWCHVAHVSPWQPTTTTVNNGGAGGGKIQKPTQITIRPPQPTSITQRKPRIDNNHRVSGREYCKQKLGIYAKCTDANLPLNKDQYEAEGTTFTCSCQDSYYLNDEFKCKQAHLCNSIVCPGPGSFCDESKPFNPNQPCQCDQAQGWFPVDEISSFAIGQTISQFGNTMVRCQRKQCSGDRKADCQFDAHICLPTLPGDKPICKCDLGFSLTQDKEGNKWCQSIACNLPSLNNCQHICQPNNNDRNRPYTCTCHPGFSLQPDGRSCAISNSNANGKPTSATNHQCKPSCNKDTQICTQHGCKCKQGYLTENELTSQIILPDGSEITYTQSVTCVNICSVSHGDAKQALVQAACPLGTCDSATFACKCSPTITTSSSDSSSAIEVVGFAANKYEPDVPSSHVYNNATLVAESSPDAPGNSILSTRASMCRLKRVCEPGSPSFQVCQTQGAFCVPDYTKTAMFDCLCPPSTEKHQSSSLVSDFTCEPKCNNSKSDCLRKMAVCKLYDKNQAKCECMPGFMESSQNQKCYLAKYSYSFSLQILNRYYEKEDKLYALVRNSNNVTSSELMRAFKQDLIKPTSLLIENSQQQQTAPSQFRRVFNPTFNQCNITQIIPQAVIEDRYDHDLETLLNYMDQCNHKLHQDMETHHLYHRVAEDVKKTLKQHLTDFSLITKESSCFELDATGRYLNCTLYLQSMQEPITKEILEAIFSQCDKPGIGDEFCWIKPRILIKKIPKSTEQITSSNFEPTSLNTKIDVQETSFGNFKQIIPCELKGFCDINSHSVRLDNQTSLCSCKCNPGIEVDDAKQLEEFESDDVMKIAIRETCVPRDHCAVNPELFCLAKPGSKCHYDKRHGSKCICEFPAYEFEGFCKQASDSSKNAIWIIIIILLVALAISMLVNIWAVSKSKNGCGKSKQYQLNEFPASPTFRRPNNRSTGVPNPAFSDEE